MSDLTENDSSILNGGELDLEKQQREAAGEQREDWAGEVRPEKGGSSSTHWRKQSIVSPPNESRKGARHVRKTY